MSDFDLHTKLDSTDAEEVVEKVRERYAAFATAGTSCCGPATDVVLRIHRKRWRRASGTTRSTSICCPRAPISVSVAGRPCSTSSLPKARPSSISGPAQGSTR